MPLSRLPGRQRGVLPHVSRLVEVGLRYAVEHAPLGHQHQLRRLGLGDAGSDVLVLRDGARLQEVLVGAGHLEDVSSLEVFDHALLVRRRSVLIGVPHLL